MNNYIKYLLTSTEKITQQSKSNYCLLTLKVEELSWLLHKNKHYTKKKKDEGHENKKNIQKNIIQ